MYKEFYQLSCAPFSDQRENLHCWTSKHGSAIFDELKNLLVENSGVFVLSGDAGVGKTFLVDSLLDTMDENFMVGYCCLYDQDQMRFYNQILSGFGIQAAVTAKVQFYLQLNRFMQQCYKNNDHLLLVIDNAHVLSQVLLDDLRQIVNFEHSGQKIVRLLLVGNRELPGLLEHEQNRAMQKKKVSSFVFPRLSAAETRDYFLFCLKSASSNDNIFDRNAIDLIIRYSNGKISTVNALGEMSLTVGCKNQHRTIGTESVLKAAEALQLKGINDENCIESGTALKNNSNGKKRKTDIPEPLKKNDTAEGDRSSSWSFGLKVFAVFCVVAVGYFVSTIVLPVWQGKREFWSSQFIEEKNQGAALSLEDDLTNDNGANKGRSPAKIDPNDRQEKPVNTIKEEP